MWRENCMTIFKIFKRDFPKVLKNAHSCLLLSGKSHKNTPCIWSVTLIARRTRLSTVGDVLFQSPVCVFVTYIAAQACHVCTFTAGLCGATQWYPLVWAFHPRDTQAYRSSFKYFRQTRQRLEEDRIELTDEDTALLLLSSPYCYMARRHGLSWRRGSVLRQQRKRGYDLWAMSGGWLLFSILVFPYQTL